MSPWWNKSSSEEVKKKSNSGGIFGTIQRKLKSPSESKHKTKGSNSRVGSPSTLVARSQSFAERPLPHPLPLPDVHPTADSGKRASRKSGIGKGSSLTPHKPSRSQKCPCDDPSDSRLLSPQVSDYEKNYTNSPSSAVYKIQNHHIATQKRREKLKPVNTNTCLNNQTVPTSPKRRPLSRHMAKLQIPQSGAFFSAPDSSMSSPSRSPMRVFGPDPTLTSGLWAGRPYADAGFLGSGQCSSPGSGHNSGHNSVGGDMSATQLLWQHSRCSPECSPIPSPRMTSPWS
ncbi:unnamed protein product [Lactuca virosa]|uniref:DUF4005 domain-containing protein n=1 Tax=Lactuca virosa TaxID=75947 RepID=A0AAU9LM22_9ASTR|nr:unnamed protein product [Lactuca virosa]